MSKKLLLSLLVLSSSLAASNAQSWLWARQGRNAGKTAGLNGCLSIASDKDHNVYTTGRYDSDTLILNSDTLFGQPYETYLVKYDDNGNILWAKSSQTNKNNVSQFNGSDHVITDSRGNAYITGVFEDTINFQSFSLKSPANFVNTFLVKYNANGNVLWAKQSVTKTKTLSYGNSIATDKSDKYIYMTGGYQDSVFFDAFVLKGTNYNNPFLVKYDSNGSVIWAKQGINSVTGYALGQDVITDDMGYIYVTGFFEDTVTFDTKTLSNITAYQFNLFIVKYDSNGNVIWAKQPMLPKGNSAAFGNALGKDKSGNIYLTGYFSDSISFGTYNFISPNPYSYDIFWAKYDNNGNIIWAKQAFNIDSLQWYGWSITTDDKDNLYFAATQANAGSFKAKIIFDTDTLQSDVRDGSVWLKFDSNGTILNSYIFPTGGGSQVQTVTDSSGCYVYFGGTTFDTAIVFGADTVGPDFPTFWPFISRWSNGACIETAENIINPKNYSPELYPNPNKGIFTIALNHSQFVSASPAIVEVYNILGEKIYNLNLTQENTIIDLSNKAAGIYLCRVISINGNFLLSSKFAIQ